MSFSQKQNSLKHQKQFGEFEEHEETIQPKISRRKVSITIPIARIKKQVDLLERINLRQFLTRITQRNNYPIKRSAFPRNKGIGAFQAGLWRLLNISPSETVKG